jgi:para-nitrobenzyl esterase
MADFSGAGPDADALAENTMDAWLAFARNGDPSSKGIGRWPAYTVADRTTALLGARCTVERAPLEDERAAWSAVPKHLYGSI